MPATINPLIETRESDPDALWVSANGSATTLCVEPSDVFTPTGVRVWMAYPNGSYSLYLSRQEAEALAEALRMVAEGGDE